MQRRITVAYLVRPAEGGIKSHLLTLLAGLDKKQFLPVVICPTDSPLFSEVEKAGYKAIPINLAGDLSPAKDLNSVLALRHILRQLRPSVLHIHSAKAGLIGRLAVIGLPKPPKVIVTMHSFVFDERVNPRKRRLIAAAERFLSKYTARIIAVSDALKNELVEEMGISPDKVKVIKNGIVFRDVSKPPRCNNFVVGTVCRLAPQKGVDDFIRAAMLVSNRYPSTQFPIVGDGPLRETLERDVSTLGLVENVKFLGFQQDALSIMATFDVFALASTSEAFGMTLTEAMSIGIPVVAGRAGGIPEIIDGTTTGLLANRGDPIDLAGKICELLENRERAQEIGEAGKKFVRSQFGSDRMIDETQKLYLRVR